MREIYNEENKHLENENKDTSTLESAWLSASNFLSPLFLPFPSFLPFSYISAH